MIESELRLRVPEGAIEAVRRAVRTRQAAPMPLQALHFDTADARLAAAGLSLLLRREGTRWAQVLELAGDGAAARLVHEVAVNAAARGAPAAPDPVRHAGTPLAQPLQRALDGAAPLQAVFAIDIQRTRRTIRHDGCVIALSLDEGAIRAGESAQALCEIGLELVRGPFAGLAALATQWIERHGLWLDSRSPAERGWLLARGQPIGPAVRSTPSGLRRQMRPDAAMRLLVGECLQHLLPNLSALASGLAQPEHLHQARVAVRRLRTVLRHMGYWCDAVEPAWEADLAALLGILGAARDRDVLAQTLLPRLLAAGAPLAELPPSADGEADPALVARAAGTHRLMVDLLAFALGDGAAATTEADLRAFARPLLRRLHRELLADSRTFLADTDTRKHRTRRRLKRLRYCAEFLAPLFPAKRVAAYLKALEPAQEALGEFNDATVAQRLFRSAAEQEGRAWFAVGWLVAQRPRLLQAADECLQALHAVPRFWRRHGGGEAAGR